MRDQIVQELATQLDKAAAGDLLNSFEELIAKQRSGDLEGALTKAGRFVEHALRLVEGKRTGTVPSDIKSVAATVRSLEQDTSLPESVRMLIPRVLYGMIYDLRSKRNAVHVKEVDPRAIDVALAATAAGWVVAELLRIYHSSNEEIVTQIMTALTRTAVPYIEKVGGETFVGQVVKPKTEILLLLAHEAPGGLTRKALGLKAKCSQPAITKGLQALLLERLIHFAASDQYFITASGESNLARELLANGAKG